MNTGFSGFIRRRLSAFFVSELDPGFGEGEVLRANRREGQARSPRQGPLPIIAPVDRVNAWWVRQANRLGDLRGASTNPWPPWAN
jgi:hypothetical protein